jgi:hypothetical protein
VGREGQPVHTAYHRSGLSGWTTVPTVPAAVVDAGVCRSLRTTAGGAAALLLLALALGVALARRIARPVRDAALTAEALGSGARPR